MKTRIVALATGIAAIAALFLLAVALAPAALAQTPGPTPGAAQGAGPGYGPGSGTQARAGLGVGYGMGGPQSSLVAVAADKLGMTVQDLVTALGGTKSIAQVAEERNVPVSNIVDGFIAPRTERLATMVEAGRITQEQADQMLATMRTQVTERINEVWTPNGNGNGNGNGQGAAFVDTDNDGVCDNMENGTQPGTGTRMGPGAGAGAGSGGGGMMGRGGRGR